MPYYTGIGSRETPHEVLDLMEDAGYRLARIGYTLRSGKAFGADSAFQAGAQRFHKESKYYQTPYSIAEVYIPWEGFKGGEGLTDIYDIPLTTIDNHHPLQIGSRQKLVKEVHGGWDKLSQGAKKLHERNVHQIFGQKILGDHYEKSKFVIYYSPETKAGNPRGGTATCVNIAKKEGVSVLNLLHKSNREILGRFLRDLEEKRMIK